MNLPFETFDADEKINPEKELTFIEKGIIISLILFAKIAIRKIRRAKTYGDLYSLADKLDVGFDKIGKSMDQKFGEGTSDKPFKTEDEVLHFDKALKDLGTEL